MRSQTAYGIAMQKWNYKDLYISVKDKNILRELAKQNRDFANRDCEEVKKKLWYEHNSLKTTRPVVLIDLEDGWNEVVKEKDLICEGELARNFENTLRKNIFASTYLDDDRVNENIIDINYIYEETDWGMKEKKITVQNAPEDFFTSYTWAPPLKNYDEIDKLKYPQITVDFDQTKKLLDIADDTFQDLTKVRLKGVWWWSLGITYILINLRGLEQFLLDFYDYPNELHQLISFIAEGFQRKIEYLEDNGLFSLNNDGAYVGSGGFGYTNDLPQKDFDSRKVRAIDIWGFSESQESSTISPNMYKEFIFPHQKKLLEKFGLNCYGCCEPVNKNWDAIKTIPRLRRVSVSPWADWRMMSDMLAKDYIYSMKPNPAVISVPHIDSDEARRSIKEALNIGKNNILEIILKDIITVGNNPQNAMEWCKIAKEEAMKI